MQNNILCEKYKLIIGYIGVMMLIVGISMIVPILIMIVYPETRSEFFYFFIPGISTIILGGILKKIFLKGDNEIKLSIQESGIIVVFSWLMAVIVCGLPFVISGQLNFVQAIFEAVSGLTTTGLSVVNVEKTSNAFLLWRSMMQFLGGAGLAVIMLSAIIGPNGIELYNAEARSDKLMPHVKKSTTVIMMIYIGYIVGGIVLYIIVGMPWFDAINHSIAAVSTGGFSTKTLSIGYYDSVSIEFITTILMILGTINFAAHTILLKGKIKEFFQIGEIKFLGFVLFAFIPIVFYFCTINLFESISKAWRVAIFEVVSALSTTGFSTVGYTSWNGFGAFALIIAMLIGGGTGSTAGGIKHYRVYVLLKSLWWNIKSFILPKRVYKQYYVVRPDGKYYVNDKHLTEITSVLTIYLLTFIVCVFILLAHGYEIKECMFEIASCLSTVGLSMGITSPDAPSFVLLTESAAMFLGRLEFVVVFYSILRIIKDIRFKFGKR